MANIRFRVVRQGPSPLEVESQVKFMFTEIKQGLKFLGEQTRDHMRSTIKANTKRGGTGRLANAIDVEVLETPESVNVGVGRTTDLPPYWLLINFGGMSTIAARGETIYGHFGTGNAPRRDLAGTGRGTEPWTTGVEPLFPMKPKNPVPAFNYIEKAGNFAIQTTSIHLNGRMRKFTRNI